MIQPGRPRRDGLAGQVQGGADDAVGVDAVVTWWLRISDLASQAKVRESMPVIVKGKNLSKPYTVRFFVNGKRKNLASRQEKKLRTSR
jgi:hypothetical protein